MNKMEDGGLQLPKRFGELDDIKHRNQRKLMTKTRSDKMTKRKIQCKDANE